MQTCRALDIYRFLAATFVAFGHFASSFQLGLDTFTPLAVRFALFLDFFSTPPGFVIALNHSSRITDGRSYGAFMWRRMARLWPLHMPVLGFFGKLGMAGHLAGCQFNDPGAFKLSALPWNILLLQAWGLLAHLMTCDRRVDQRRNACLFAVSGFRIAAHPSRHGGQSWAHRFLGAGDDCGERRRRSAAMVSSHL